MNRFIKSLLLLCSSSILRHTFAFQSQSRITITGSLFPLVRQAKQLIRPIPTTSLLVQRNSKDDDNGINGIDDEQDKKRVALKDGYDGMVKLNVLLSVLPFLSSGTPPNKFSNAAGLLVAAGFTRMLSDATLHNRLNSDTYKRLNLSLLVFHVVTLLTNAFGDATGLQRPARRLVLISICKIFGAGVAFTGWQQGLGANTKMFQDLRDGIASTFSRSLVTKGRGVLYRNSLLASLIFPVVYTYRFASHAFALQYSRLPVGLYADELANFSLAAIALYTLKDAGERNRLKGTTFIQMNHLMGTWLILCGLDIVSQPGKHVVVASTAMVSFGIVFFMMGYLLKLEKDGKLEYFPDKRRWATPRKEE